MKIEWLNMPGGRTASSLGKGGGFVILGPSETREKLRPTVAHGQVVAGDIRLVSGLLTMDDLAALRGFWKLAPR